MINLVSVNSLRVCSQLHSGDKMPWHQRELHHQRHRFLYLEEHGAVLVRVGRLDVVRRAGVSAAGGALEHALPRLLLQTPCQAAAARAKFLRLLKTGVLQDALGERSPQAALAGAAREAFTCEAQTGAHEC